MKADVGVGVDVEMEGAFEEGPKYGEAGGSSSPSVHFEHVDC